MKNPTEELAVHMLFTLVVGYFAYAQYDVKSPIGGVAATSPEGGSEFRFIVFASVAKQSPGRVNCRVLLPFSSALTTFSSKEKTIFISTDICGSVYPKTFRGYCTTNEFILQAF